MPAQPGGHVEHGDRSVQRELVLQQIQNPISRETIRNGIPSVGRPDYSISNFELSTNFTNLVRTEGGNAYKHILGAATVAQNPQQLDNAFGALALLNHRALSYQEDAQYISQAQDAFLRNATTTPFASDGARSIQGQMIGMWHMGRGHEGSAMNYINGIYDGVYGAKKDEVARSWAEGYLLTVMDPQTPYGLRKALLANAILLKLGDRHSSQDPRFTPNVSFWQTVNAEWVYPGLLGQDGQGDDPTAKEIAGLRRQVDALQKAAGREGVADDALEKERVRLKALAENLQRTQEAMERKLKIYQKCGGHPLEQLGIGTHTWATTPVAEREELVRKHYRQKSLEVHPDRLGAGQSKAIVDLARKEFTRYTEAYEYLVANRNENTF